MNTAPKLKTVTEAAADWMRLLRDATNQEHEIAMLDAILAALAPPSGEGVEPSKVTHDAALAQALREACALYESQGKDIEHCDVCIGVLLDRTREILRTATTPQSAPVDGPKLHFATRQLVDAFSIALAEKLAAAEAKYGYSDGWRDPSWMDECRTKLLEHVAKGDPRDVAAYCAFLWHHGESTTPPPASQERGDTTFRPGWRFPKHDSVHAVPDFASSDMARQQREQYLNSPEGLQWRQTVALEKLAASPPSSAAEHRLKMFTKPPGLHEAGCPLSGTPNLYASCDCGLGAAEQAMPVAINPVEIDSKLIPDAAEQAKPVAVHELALKLNCKPSVVIKELAKLGVMATITQRIGQEEVELVVSAIAEQAQAGEFREWFRKNAPGGTVISDPDWWVDRILRRLAGGVTDEMVERAAFTWRYYTGSTENNARMRAALVAALGADRG